MPAVVVPVVGGVSELLPEPPGYAELLEQLRVSLATTYRVLSGAGDRAPATGAP